MVDKTTLFVDKAVAIHGNRYSYDKSVYVNVNKKLIVTCPYHGDWLVTPYNHVASKSGCPSCSIDTRKNTNLKKYGVPNPSQVAEFQERKKATNIKNRGTEWPLSSEEVKQKVKETHLQRRGVEYPMQSPEVIQKRKARAQATLGVPSHMQQHAPTSFKRVSDYKWLSHTYHGQRLNQTQIADRLGISQTTVGRYMSAYNIDVRPQSTHSEACIQWLASVMESEGVDIQHARNGGEYKLPDTRIFVDGYCADTNTVYEFHGDYWHGNPKMYEATDRNKRGYSMGELYENTLIREQQIRDMGYNLVVMWESDWNQIKKMGKV